MERNQTACCKSLGCLQDRDSGDDQVNGEKVLGRGGGDSSWIDSLRWNH